jgi:hypothetical protein
MKKSAAIRFPLMVKGRVLTAFSAITVSILLASPSFAQERIYRCGNEYTNNIKDAKGGNCKLVEGGNVTVIQGSRTPAGGTGKAAPTSQTSSNSGQRVDNTEQRARDSDSRGILEAELKKAEAKQAELLKEYNNGQPEKQGPETKNNQKYLDRVAELKANIARNDSDIAGIKRELGRNTTSPSAKTN